MSVARYSCLVLILLATASMLSADHLHDLLQDSSRNYLKSKFKRSPSTFGDTCSRKTNRVDDDTTTMDVTFPRASIKHSDQYLCTSQKVPFNGEESYIVKFNPIASMNISHHMLVYGCQDAGSNEKFWDCGRRSVCSGKHTILYAWARNAPSLDMPDGLGFRIGGDSGYNYLIVQMHYVNPTKPGEYDCSGFSATITKLKQNYYAGIYLLGSPWISIPAHSPMSTVDISCPNTATASIHVFAFRTHAHDFGQVITGYRYRNGIYKMIGKGNPQWPHAFYPRVGGAIDIEPGDTIIARCTYRNDQDRVVHQGMGGGDEMCNFYMMYYTADVSLVNKDLECWGNIYPKIKFPPNANDPAPYPGYAGADSDKAIRAGESNPHHQDVERTRDPGNAVNEGISQVPGTSSDVVFDQLWPAALSGVGQVGGVAVDWRGGVYVFHRAERVWDFTSFDSLNRFTKRNQPINADTMFVYDFESGNLTHRWGRNMFYMPHGVSVDHDGNIWLTDVAMHQVMKFAPGGSKEPLLTLGEKFMPGSDIKHFCKPTDVAIERDGTFYVADGYCNGRVVKFSKNGNFITTWGRVGSGGSTAPPGVFNVVHSIALTNNETEVCVADRENGRIQCFTQDGGFIKIIEDRARLGSKVYAISYSHRKGGLLYVINGNYAGRDPSGFIINYKSAEIIDQWQPSGHRNLNRPHDVAVSLDGHQVYVGQLEARKLFKFDVKSEDEGKTDLQDDGGRTDPQDDDGKSDSQDDDGKSDSQDGGGRTDPQDGGGRTDPQDGGGKTDPQDDGGRTDPQDDDGKTDSQEPDDGQLGEVEQPSNAVTAIVTLLVMIPLVVALICYVLIQTRKRRLRKYKELLPGEGSYPSYECAGSQKVKLNLGTFFTSGKSKNGFERVNTNIPSDDDTQSEDELYSNVMQK